MFPTSDDKLFINKDSMYSTAYGANWQDLEWYAASYKFAFEALIERCEKDIPSSQYLFVPIIFNFRHYLEIRLKGILRILNHPEYRKHSHHDILRIWQAIKIEYTYCFDNENEEEFLSFEKLICEFSELDKLSFNFRYPYDKEFKKSLEFSIIEFDNFIKVSRKMIAFVESFYGYLADNSE